MNKKEIDAVDRTTDRTVYKTIMHVRIKTKNATESSTDSTSKIGISSSWLKMNSLSDVIIEEMWRGGWFR